MQLIHRALFGEIYPWAGTIRQKGFISKGNALFCGAEYIKPYSDELFRKLHDENLLVGMHRDEFIDRMAFCISEVNALHPFREGNGRTQRVFANQLAKQAGWSLNLRTIDPDALCGAYITAMTDLNMLVSLLQKSVEPVQHNS